jgi:TM2 domain-containing membrane protein YozV
MTVDIARMAAHLPPEQRQDVIRAYRRGAQNETAAYLYCFFLGIFGAHRWYLGHWRSALAHLIIPLLAVLAVVAGVLQLIPPVVAVIIVAILLAIGLVWEIVDLFGIDDEVRAHNLALAERLTAAGALADDTLLEQAVEKLDTLVRAEAPPQEAPSAAAVGGITAADVADARALAEEQGRVTSFEYYATADTRISDSPAQEQQQPAQPGANDWSFTETIPHEQPERPQEPAASPPFDAETTMPFGQMAAAAAAAAPLAEDVVSFQHHETAYGTTESLEIDHVALPPEAVATPAPTSQDEDTWPEVPLAAGAAATAGAVAGAATDWTDMGPAGDDVPIADIEPEPGAVKVALPDEGSFQAAPLVTLPPAAGAAVSQTGGIDHSDAHPHVHHVRPIADVEPGLAEPLYVALPDEADETTVVLVPDVEAPQSGLLYAGAAASEDTQPVPPEAYVPPTVPVMTSQVEAEPETLAELAPLAASGATAGMLAAEAAPGGQPAEPPIWPAEPQQAAEQPASPALAAATPETVPAPVPQRMKRVRVVRRVVVDGKVVREQVVEEIVPVDTDTATTAAHLRESLGHATPEEIAQMAHLDPNAPIELRQKTEMPDSGESQA